MSNGGPWGTGGGQNDGGKDDDAKGGGRNNDGRGNWNDDRNRPNGARRPSDGIPEIDELMKKGSEHLRVLMGGRSGGGNGNGTGGGLGPKPISAGAVGLGLVAAIAVWGWGSLYQVQQNERSIELLFGKYYATGNPGLNFAPWPFVKSVVIPVTDERTTELGNTRSGNTGLMLTRDQNIVNIEFQVVWNISDPGKYLFNLADPEDTIRAVSESAMRDIIARTDLAPILNRDRGAIGADLRQAVQKTLDSYGVGINIVRVNFNRADPPTEVIDSFRDVQAAQQERDRLEKEADAYANKVTAGARGEAAQMQEQAEAYRAQVVNDAQGEAARFTSIYEVYKTAPDVTKRRMFFDAMGRTLGGLDKVMVDQGSGTVPYLPLDRLTGAKPGTAAPAQTQSNGGSN